MSDARDSNVMVFVLNYEQTQFTSDCIDSLLKSDYRDFHVVALDNGSRDVASEILKRRFPQVTVFRSEINLGCAGGRNFGIRHFLKETTSQYLFFLDNDTVMAPDALGELIRLMERNQDVGIVAPFFYYFDQPDTVHIGGGGFITWHQGRFYGLLRGTPREPQDNDREVDFAPGGMCLARRQAVQRAGYFDERYFIYFEDPDWCYRVRKAGYRVLATPRAKVLHRVSQSVGMESPHFYYYRTRNRLLFMKKNARLRDRLRFLVAWFPWELSYETLLTLFLSRQYAQFKAVLVGIWDHLAGRYGKKERMVFEFKPFGAKGLNKAKHLIDRFVMPRGLAFAVYVGRTLALRTRPSGIRVLVYHSVDREGDPRLGISPERFREHLSFFRTAGYRMLTEDELLRHLSGGEPIRGPALLLTFDDGYRDLHTHALPLLREAGVSALVFLVSSFMRGERLTFLDDYDPTLSSRFALNAAEIAAMRQAGLTFGSHGRTHRDLRSLPEREVLEELLASRNDIEAAIGCPVRSFAFPYGGGLELDSPEQSDAVEKAYAMIFGTRSARVSRGDARRIPRTTISGSDTVFDLRLKLAGAYDWYFNSAWVRKWKAR